MASVTVDTKIIIALYTGTQALTLNLANAPWLSNVVKIIRPSANTGINTRQSYNGAYNGATPGGAVSTLQPGLLYEITSGTTNGWTLPDFSRVVFSGDAPANDNIVEFTVRFPGGLSNPGKTEFKVLSADEEGTYRFNSNRPNSGVTGLAIKKNGVAVSNASFISGGVALTLTDVLELTATTAANTPGFVNLTNQ